LLFSYPSKRLQFIIFFFFVSNPQAADQIKKLEEAQSNLEEKLQEADANALKVQATVRQLQTDLSSARGRLDLSEAAGYSFFFFPFLFCQPSRSH